MRIPNPNATETVKIEDAEFEVSVTLPISFKNQYADKLIRTTADTASYEKLYEIQREIVRKALKSCTVLDADGTKLSWTGEFVPDQILDKLSSVQVKPDRPEDGSICLVNRLGKTIWELNTKGFFRREPDKAGDTDN